MKTLKDFDFRGKKVLVRCDFNVPLNKEGLILDDFRIRQTIPTIEYLIEKGAKLLLISHLDDPGGRVVESLRLTPIQEKLMEYLDLSITKAQDCIGKEVEDWINQMQSGEILLLENLRFHKEEEEFAEDSLHLPERSEGREMNKVQRTPPHPALRGSANEENFAKKLAKLGDIYINDAFGACHRVHASIVGVPKYLPSGMGFLLEKEIKVLSDLLEKPKKPLIAIIGGKKVETKVKLIDKISEIADLVLIGGLIKEEIDEKGIILKHPEKIISPVDRVDSNPPTAQQGCDIGPKTINLFKEKIALAKTIFWNGPLGKIEEEEFQKGSKEIAQAVIESGAFSVAGGGETVEFINNLGLTEKFNHLSTGGGAMLDFIVDGKLVGIEALR